jgi:hypothetical protein
MMFNSRNLGALIVAEEPHVNEWDEPQFGIKNIGIEEKYTGSACSTKVRQSQWQIRPALSSTRDVDTAGARSSRGSGNAGYESAEDLIGAN